jgi:RND family efflux transporter MFP subunit
MNLKMQKVLDVVKKLPPKLCEFIITFPQKHRQAYISLIVLLSATALAIIIVMFKKAPKKEEPQKFSPLVEVKQIQKQDINMVVIGYGTARAQVEVEIVPQVSGKIVSVSPQFQAGGFIKADEEMFRIDPRDYELIVRQARAGVADAMVKLDMEKAEAAIALDEWWQLHPGTEPDSPLVLREPQIRQAQALLESTQAALAVAELNLERTSISLPVDVRIVSEDIDLGQFVSAGQAVGHAYGIEAVEIEIPLDDKELGWIEIPDPAMRNNSKGSLVFVEAEFAGKERIWKGYVARTTGRVDPTSRLVYVVVQVPNPYNVNDVKSELLPGTFVQANIHGIKLVEAFAVPRNSLHNRNEVWIVKDGKLHITELDIVRADKDYAYTTDTLEDGDLIVTSTLEAVVDGMGVRIKQDDKPQGEN